MSDDESKEGAEAGLISGFLSKLKNSGEAAFDELSNQLMENKVFMSAMRKSLEAKDQVDRTVSGTMDFMNLPSKNDVDRLMEEIDGLRSRMVKQQRVLKKIDQRLDEIAGLLRKGGDS
jgi:hypothetical protein